MTSERSQIDDPGALAEVAVAFDRYEAALVANDVALMDSFFWDDDRTVRFGIAENLHGYRAVARWRAAAEPVPVDRRITWRSLLAVGTDVVQVDCEFRNGDDPSIGRQSQLWVRRPEGWRIVRAHVSLIDEP